MKKLIYGAIVLTVSLSSCSREISLTKSKNESEAYPQESVYNFKKAEPIKTENTQEIRREPNPALMYIFR